MSLLRLWSLIGGLYCSPSFLLQQHYPDSRKSSNLPRHRMNALFLILNSLFIATASSEDAAVLPVGRVHKWPRTSHSYNSTHQHHSRTTCIQVEPARQTDLCDHCHKIKPSHAPTVTIKRVSSIQLTHWSGLSFTSRSTLIWRKQRQQNASIVHAKTQKCGTSSFPSEPVPSILSWRARDTRATSR